MIATFLVADPATCSFLFLSCLHGGEISVKQSATHRWWQFNTSQAIGLADRIWRLAIADVFEQSAQTDAVSSPNRQHGRKRGHGRKRHFSAFACSGTNSQRHGSQGRVAFRRRTPRWRCDSRYSAHIIALKTNMQLTTISSYSKVDQRNSSQSPVATTYGKTNCQSRHPAASSALSPTDYELCFKA